MLGILLKIVAFLRRVYWKMFKPLTLGVRVIVVCENEVLLIQTRYSKQWYLPGGRVRKKEGILAAVKRELKEECGMELGQHKLLGVYSNFVEAKNDHIVLFISEAPDKKTNSGLEISFCQFFPLNALPPNVSPGTLRRLDEYKNNSFKVGVDW